MRTTFPAHLILLDLILIIFGEQCYMMTFLMKFSRHLLFYLRLEYFLQHPVLKRPQSTFSFRVRDQVLRPYKTTSKIVIITENNYLNAQYVS
jgi:hypothetical protein